MQNRDEQLHLCDIPISFTALLGDVFLPAAEIANAPMHSVAWKN